MKTGKKRGPYNYDQNGDPVYENVCREYGGWGVTVWSGWGCVTNVRRYVYETRRQARSAAISDDLWKRGRIG